MDRTQEATRYFLELLLSATGLAPSALAKLSGIRHTTLTRFLNDPNHKSTISLRTLNSVIEAAQKHGLPETQIEALRLIANRRPEARTKAPPPQRQSGDRAAKKRQ